MPRNVSVTVTGIRALRRVNSGLKAWAFNRARLISRRMCLALRGHVLAHPRRERNGSAVLSASRATARKTVDSPLSRRVAGSSPTRPLRSRTVAMRCLRCLVRHTRGGVDPFIIKTLLYESVQAHCIAPRARLCRLDPRREEQRRGYVTGKWGACILRDA